MSIQGGCRQLPELPRQVENQAPALLRLQGFVRDPLVDKDKVDLSPH